MLEIIEILGACHEGKTNYILENYLNNDCIYFTNESTREEIIKKLDGKYDFNNLKYEDLPIINNVKCNDPLLKLCLLTTQKTDVINKRILILDGFFDKNELNDFIEEMYVLDRFDKIIYTTQVSRKLSAKRKELKI